MIVATISVDIHAARPNPGDPVLGEADAVVGGKRGEIRLTTRGLYLVLKDGSQGCGIDLNALALAMVDAVAPPKRTDGGRNG